MLDHALGEHRVGDPAEPGDVRPVNVVPVLPVLVGGVTALLVDAPHDLAQPLVDAIDAEAWARQLLARYGVVFRDLVARETSLPP